jgi:hypothetical protein
MLVAGLTACALAQAEIAQSLPAGTPVVIVGEISSHPKDFGFVVQDKMQIEVGPEKTDYTLHLGGAKMFDATTGEKMAKSGLRDKWWVRAEGVFRPEPGRIQVKKLEVIAKDRDAYQRSAYWATGRENGYLETVAGSRQIYP